MTVRVYQSTDTGAPVLTGEVGSLIPVLDACLVNGYDVKPGAGWTKAFSGTNKAAYKQGAGSNGFYLQVDDSNALAIGTDFAVVRAFESMTDVDTGTNPMYTGDNYIAKSNTADAVAREWMVVATEKMMYFFVYYISDATTVIGHAFGDIVSHLPGDAYHTIAIVCTNHAYSIAYIKFQEQSSSMISPINGHFTMRSHSGVAGGATSVKYGNYSKQAGNIIGGGGSVYPDPITNGLLISPIWWAAANAIRGTLPGIWAPLHNKPLTPKDTFSGSGDLIGKDFMVVGLYGSGQVFVEISDTW